MRTRLLPQTGRRSWSANALLLALLALSATGCATHSPPVIVPPAAMPKPAPELMAPPPSERFSDRAARNMKRWRETLTPSPDD